MLGPPSEILCLPQSHREHMLPDALAYRANSTK